MDNFCASCRYTEKENKKFAKSSGTDPFGKRKGKRRAQERDRAEKRTKRKDRTMNRT